LLQGLALGCAERRLGELRRDRQADLGAPIFAYVVHPAPVTQWRGWHDDAVSVGVSPGQVRSDQVGYHGDRAGLRHAEGGSLRRWIGGKRMERDDHRRLMGLHSICDDPVNRPQVGLAGPAQRAW